MLIPTKPLTPLAARKNMMGRISALSAHISTAMADMARLRPAEMAARDADDYRYAAKSLREIASVLESGAEIVLNGAQRETPAPSAPVVETGVVLDAPRIDPDDYSLSEAADALHKAGYKMLSKSLDDLAKALRSPRPVAATEALEAAYREGFEDGNVVDAPLASQGWRDSETRRKATPDGAPSDG